MMVVLVTRKEKFFKSKEIAEAIHEELPEVVSVIQNINEEKNKCDFRRQRKSFIWQRLYRRSAIRKTYRISAKSFYQVNTQQAEYLYQTAIKFA